MADGGHPHGPTEHPGSAAAFYDGLAPSYDRLYPEWDAAIEQQADVLDRLLRQRLGDARHRVLDCTVGIGTQALGLARLGHRVSGTDVSEGSLARARAEADRRGVTVSLTVADLRALPFAAGSFDAVVSVDSFAHLHSVDEATEALGEMARVSRPGGVVVVSLRDYTAARREHPPGTLPQVKRTPTRQTIAFQVWDWLPDGRRYDLTHVVLESHGQGWTVTPRHATLSAFTGAELLDAAQRAGLTGAAWLSPEETGFFQPLLVAGVATAGESADDG